MLRSSRYLVLATAMCLSLAPAHADSIDNLIKKEELPAAPVRFKDKHPKVYKAFRKTRFICIVVKPIIEVSAATAQIVLPFII